MTAPFPLNIPKPVNIPYVILNDGENQHAAFRLGALRQKVREGRATDSEQRHMSTLMRAILDYQVEQATIKAAR